MNRANEVRRDVLLLHWSWQATDLLARAVPAAAVSSLWRFMRCTSCVVVVAVVETAVLGHTLLLLGACVSRQACCVGPTAPTARSYLAVNITKIVEAIKASGAQAVSPASRAV